MFDRVLHPARGRDGGGDGATGQVYTYAAKSDSQDPCAECSELPGKGRDEVLPGQRLVLTTPGGGGVGDSTRRDPLLDAGDRQAGLLE